MSIFSRKKEEPKPAAPAVPPAKPAAPSAPQPPPQPAAPDQAHLSPKDLAQNVVKIRTALAEADAILLGKPNPFNKKQNDAEAAPVVAAKVKDEKDRDRSLYKELLGSLYDAILIVDPKNSVIGSNRRSEQLFAYDGSDLWGMPCQQLISAMTPTVLSQIRVHVESGRFTMVNATCQRKDGSAFPAEIAINRVNLFHEGDLLLSVRSIERRLKAHERREAETDVARHAGAGIVVCNTDGLIELANPAFLRLVHVEQEKDVLQRFMGEFCTTPESGSALLLRQSVEGKLWIGRLQLATADSRTVEVLATSALGHSGKQAVPARIILTFTPLPKMAISRPTDSAPA